MADDKVVKKNNKVKRSPDGVSRTENSKKFNIVDAVRKDPLYKSTNRDPKARQIIEENIERAGKGDIVPGQLILFKYLNPKTKEELEYYDASPCTIFFGVFNSSLGRRVLGFNIHYFPPVIRYRIMDKIYEMYRPVYTKYFETGLNHELDGFDYNFLTNELKKHNLDFACRMYDPTLIGDVRTIPPKMWPTAIFTEGWFKKETRARIMEFFRNGAKLKNKQHTARGLSYNRKK